MLLENGTYRAVVKDISVYLRGENERLTGAFRLDCEGKELVHREWLELNDGTISDKTIKRLRECFPKWDGSIETLEQGFCVQDVEVEVTVENEQDKQDPEKWWTRTKFMDPPGGSSGGAAALPDKESRATLVGKYGARFRALAGGTPATRSQKPSAFAEATADRDVSGQRPETEKAGPATAPQAGPPPAPMRPPAHSAGSGQAGLPPGPTAKAAAISTLEECWDALCKKHPDEFREQVSERWFKLLEQIGEGKDQADFGPEDWGRVMGVIVGDGVPF